MKAIVPVKRVVDYNVNELSRTTAWWTPPSRA